MYNVLVVDDDKGIRELIRTFLVKEGFNVTAAIDGSEGLSIIESRIDIDLVVLDFTMPGVSGLDIINKLDREKRLIPLVVLTGRSDLQGEKVFEGMNLYKNLAIHHKPIALRKLSELIKKELKM